MKPYSDIFKGSYYLCRNNMSDLLSLEHEQKLNVIDNIQIQNKLELLNERNRNNNSHVENMQILSNPRNKDNNSHVENMQRLLNEK